MQINSSRPTPNIRPSTTDTSTTQPASQKPPQEPSLGSRYADTLVKTNDSYLPQMATVGVAFAGAAKGIEIGSRFGPVGQAVGGVLGGAAGLFGGALLGSAAVESSDYLLNRGLGDPSPGISAAVKTVLGASLCSAIGGPSFGALYGVVTLGSAGLDLRQEVAQKG